MSGSGFRVERPAPVRVDAFLADSVSVDDGKLHAQGAGWNLLYTDALPTVHGRLGLGLLLRVPLGQERALHELEVRLEDPAGAEIPLALAPPDADPGARRVRGTFALDPPPAGASLDEQILATGINVDAVPLELAGRHRFVVAIDGVDTTVAEFAVLRREAHAEGASAQAARGAQR